MAINRAVVVAQIDKLLARHAQLSAASKYEDLSDLPDAARSEFVTLAAAAIDRLSPVSSRYRKEADAVMAKFGVDHWASLQPLVGILNALRADYDAGHLANIQEIIQADIFSDFLEMAEHLLEQGYKDPAAVMVGGVLEEHLRKLCERDGIPIENEGRPRKTDTMNADLVKAGVYGKLDQKSVISWLDLRNKAAHGKYGQYTREQVALTLQGVRDFVARTSV